MIHGYLKYKDKGQIFKGIDKIDDKIISEYDLILIAAAHSNIDYDMIQKNARAIFDTIDDEGYRTQR